MAARSTGTFKFTLVLLFEENPGGVARELADAVQGLGLELGVVTAHGQRQLRCGGGALSAAFARHAAAKFGATTTLAQEARQQAHGPGGFLTVRSPLQWQGPHPTKLVACWPEAARPPARAVLDGFARRLGRVLTLRAGAAGYSFVAPARPMARDARRVAEAIAAAMREVPHAHVNHAASLDTRSHALEPSWWMLLSDALAAKVAPAALDAFSPRRLPRACSLVLPGPPSRAASRPVLEQHAALAAALGPLYPPRATSEIFNSVSLKNVADFTLAQWLARYTALAEGPLGSLTSPA